MGNDVVLAKGKVTIHNMPEYATAYKYVVATFDRGSLWFWGAWDDENKAREVAYERDNRIVLEVSE